MDRVTYTGESFLTGSAIAHALLRYAESLAQTGTAATVNIPTLAEDGSTARTEVLIGPSSQLLSTRVSTDFDEIEDDALVGRLEDETARLLREGPAAPPIDTSAPAPAADWDEYDV